MTNPMYIPGFNAAASLPRAGRAYTSRRAILTPSSASVVPQISIVRGTGAGAASPARLGFTCAPWGCVCSGDADCNDMFSTNACGPWAICSDGFCFCGR